MVEGCLAFGRTAGAQFKVEPNVGRVTVKLSYRMVYSWSGKSAVRSGREIRRWKYRESRHSGDEFGATKDFSAGTPSFPASRFAHLTRVNAAATAIERSSLPTSSRIDRAAGGTVWQRPCGTNMFAEPTDAERVGRSDLTLVCKIRNQS